MKKTIVTLALVAALIVIAILFWSPWLGEDGGKAIMRQLASEVDVPQEAKKQNPNKQIKCEGLSTSWVPFGRKIEYCEYKNWYVSFWGQRL